jgi:hypothetical protein
MSLCASLPRNTPPGGLARAAGWRDKRRTFRFFPRRGAKRVTPERSILRFAETCNVFTNIIDKLTIVLSNGVRFLWALPFARVISRPALACSASALPS